MKLYAISDMHGQLDGLDPKGMDLVIVAICNGKKKMFFLTDAMSVDAPFF